MTFFLELNVLSINWIELLVQTSQNLASLQEKQAKDREQSDARDEKIANDIGFFSGDFSGIVISQDHKNLIVLHGVGDCSP